MQEFFRAIRENKVDSLRQLLKSNPELANAQYAEDCSVLSLAVHCGWPEVVKVLLDYSADVNWSRNGWTCLHAALQGSDVAITRLLLDAGADPNANQGSYTPLAAAVESASPQLVDIVLCAGADIEGKDEDGNTAILDADLLLETMRLLLRHGANVNARSKFGSTILHSAAAHGDAEMVQLLLRAGADATITNREGCTPLLSAADGSDFVITQDEDGISREIDPHAGCPEVMQMLVKHLGEQSLSLCEAAAIGNIGRIREILSNQPKMLDTPGPRGYYALHWAAIGGSKESVEMLIGSGAPINERAGEETDGDTPLLCALERSNQEVAELLIAMGADINSLNSCMFTPLHQASSNGLTDIVRLLISRGANIDARDSDANTPLLRAANSECARILIEAGADIEARGFSDETPLHNAASEWPEIVILLIQKGADIYAINDSGHTPLFDALQAAQSECIEILTNAGEPRPFDMAAMGDLANLRLRLQKDLQLLTETDSKGRSLLHYAAEFDRNEVIELLLDSGLDVNAGDDRGNTPLHVAAESLCINVAKLLITRGAHLDAQSGKSDGHTPLHDAAYHYSENQSSVSMIELLLDNGADPNIVASCGSTPLGDAETDAARRILWRRGAKYIKA